MRTLTALLLTVMMVACSESPPTETVESLAANPERLKELREQCRANRAKVGEEPLDIAFIPLDDKPTYSLLQKAETTAVFQLESRGMKELIHRLQPDCFEEIIALVEQQASCELYGLLKRPDEKYVTERAYDNPKFVEDMVRDVAGQLEADARICAYCVESENFESIHNHSAYALIEVDKTA